MRKITIFLAVTACVIFVASGLFAAENTDKNSKKTEQAKANANTPAKAAKPTVSNAAVEPAKKGKETPQPPVAKAEAAKPVKEMTQAEKVADMKETLKNNEEILTFVPGLKKEKDKNGNIFYTFQGTKLDNLDAGTVEKLFGRVRNEAVRIRTDRFNRQMAMIKKAQQAPSTVGGGRPAGMSRIPQAPKIPHIPQVPKPLPKPLPKMPQIPKTYNSTSRY